MNKTDDIEFEVLPTLVGVRRRYQQFRQASRRPPHARGGAPAAPTSS